jgi:septal ring factor EnvC (AmiA/AmiB activator)
MAELQNSDGFLVRVRRDWAPTIAVVLAGLVPAALIWSAQIEREIANNRLTVAKLDQRVTDYKLQQDAYAAELAALNVNVGQVRDQLSTISGQLEVLIASLKRQMPP